MLVRNDPAARDLLASSGMPLTIIVQPLALPHPEEEPIQVVDNGDVGPIRCSRCKAYMNPFMRFLDHTRFQAGAYTRPLLGSTEVTLCEVCWVASVCQ